MPSRLLSALKRLGACGVLCFVPGLVFGQNKFAAQGGEYPLTEAQRGDQVAPHLALGSAGGYVVWQDNATDGDGLGISARRLDPNVAAGFGSFRVNEQGAGDQQNPKAALLNNGGAIFVWQGGLVGAQDIYCRFLSRSGTFQSGDVRVNTFTQEQQVNPAIATLSNGDVIIVWSSFGQDGSMQGIFGQRFSESGQKVGAEFQVNQYASFNQRTPSVAGLENGSFVVAWVSEQRRFENSIDIYGRVFGVGSASNEFLVNAGTDVCANPMVSKLSNGGFIIGWSQNDVGTSGNSWDVFARSFQANGSIAGDAFKINTHEKGNQFAPQIAGLRGNNLIVWTSVGQDGSREGVFGRFVADSAQGLGAEFQVNTYSASQQINPTVSSDGASQFAVAWASFVGGAASFDLFAQRYSSSSAVPGAPFVSALNSSRLSVTWPVPAGTAVGNYELYIDGSSQPTAVAGNVFSAGPFAPSSTHSFKVAYRFLDGSRSALSDAATGTTWGGDDNFDGLPDDWQIGFWGRDASKWPDPKSDSDGDGASNLQEFLAGTNPTNSQSVLRTRIATTEQGNFLNWNAQPGFVYQVQTKTELNAEWVDLGSPRLAAGASDSLFIEGSDNPAYYRVKLLR